MQCNPCYQSNLSSKLIRIIFQFDNAEKALEKRLKEKEGFDSYGEICEWLEEKLGIEAKYKTVHKLVYYRLKASPKIARPKSLEQSEER